MADKIAMTRNAENASRGENEEEEYDPAAHRPPGPLTSDFAVLMHLLKTSIGNGILFLPNGFRRTGYVMSIICSVFIGLTCTHTVVVLVRCAQVLCRRNRIPMLDFAQTAEVSFQSGPRWIRKYGKTFGVFINIFVCFVHFQGAVIYILYVATSFQQVIEFFSGFEMDARIYIAALFPFVCGLGFVPNLAYLAPFSIIGFLFMFVGICVTLYYLLDNFPDPGRLETFTDVLHVPMYCNLMLYALHNVTMYMPLENTMKNPHHLPRLITFNMLLNTCLYTAFGFLGYNKYMLDTCDTVIKNLPIEETLAQTIKIVISLAVFFSFGLAYYVPMSILWPMIESKFKTPSYGKVAFQFSGILLTTLLAITIPNMIPLLGLLTALSVTTVMLLIPVLIETATKWHEATRLLLAKNISIFLIWMLLLIFGAIESTWSIIREYNGVKEKGC
ncbi:proton-coupled amino acid transporter-like protein pathetic [Hylaeus volcanicus]|uniref:proton-coupled amino acid transporter-like protein pathetic n=1 Tax=Hylaeus volcanicus TaxID=313075 RepID=UPI0023B87303|nr:proton-coupled amino acid transporter-like protein pathetic [Hylaeus volcanicus]